jgi:murein DD-endopeptidase MepM/ murein hydrolase activator NlpD
MADKAIFEIIVTDKGLKINQKKVDELGAAVERTTKKTKEAGKAQDELNYKLNQGATGVSSAARSFSKLSQAIGDGPNGLVGAYATLAANAFAVSAAFNVLRSAAQAEQVMKGLEVQGARTGQALTVTARKVQELSGYTLSLADAMQATAQASAAGFDTKTIERLTKSAADASAALGRNMPDSMDRLVKGLTKMEPELLDELGAMTKLTEASKAYALQNGKTEASLSTLEKRTAFSNAILAELELKFGGIAEESGSVARSYDRLAASFQDVTKDALNFISAGLAPLIEFLARNEAALLGVGVVFLSTIRNQIVPGINELAVAQAKAAAAQAEASKKDIESINKLGSGKRKAYNELVESIKAGTQTEAQYNAASVELAERKKAVLDKVYKDQEKGERLREVQLKKITESEKALSVAQSAGAKARREQAIASGISASEDMNAFNALGKLGGALRETREALRANSEAKKLAGKEASGLGAGFKHLGAQAAITGKIMGTALLNALPAIGQIILAISILIEIFEALKSSQRKALEAAASNLDEVVKTANNTVKELKRVEVSTASLSARTEKELIARSNAVSNLASAYKDVVRAAQDAKNAEEGAATGVAGFFDSIVGRKENRSYFLDIRQDSKILNEAVRKDTEESGKFFGANINALKTSQQILNTESVKTLDALSRLVPEETFDRVIELNGGLTKVVGSTQLTAKVIEDLAKRQGQTAQVTKDLTQSFKSADEALSEFLKSAAISTPYDNIVKSLDSITKALVDMTLAVPDSAQWAGLLTGIGPEMEKMLTSQNRQVIQQARSSDVVIQNLRAQKELTGSLTTEQQNQLDTEQNKLKALNAQVPQIIANIEQEKARFVLAQAQTREMQGQIGIIQAIMSKNQLAYSAGAAGELARIEREEQVRNIQISTLQIQKDILESSLAQTRATLTQLEAQRKLNKEINLQSSAQAVNLAQRNLESALTQARALEVPEEFITTFVQNSREMFRGMPTEGYTQQQIAARNLVVSSTQALNARRSELETDRQIVAARTEERDIVSSINNLDNQIQALREQNLTSAQKSARAARAEETVQSNIRSLETQKTNQLATNVTLSQKLLRIQRGISSNLVDQVQTIGTEYRNQLNNINSEALNQEKSLNAAIAEVVAMKATASGIELTAYNSLEQSLRTQLRLNTEISAAKRQELQTQTQINLLEAVGVKSREEQLSTLKSTIDLYQRRLDLAKSVSDQEAEISKNAVEINILRRGGEVDERTTRLLEMNAAEDALALARQQYDLKLAAVEAEYELLEAQQKTQKTNLEVQLAVLRAYYEMINQGRGLTNEQSQTLNTLSASLSNIQEIDFSAMRELEERQARNTLTLAEQAAERSRIAYNNLNRVGAAESEIINFQERRRIRAERASRESETTAGPTQVPETGNRAVEVAISTTARQTANAFTEALRTSTNVAVTTPTTPPPAPESNLSQELLRGIEDIVLGRSFPITSGMGTRIHPVTGVRSFHGGVDYGTPTGTPVYSPVTGRVSRASFDPLGGNVVKIVDEFQQVEVAALHLSRMLVDATQTVERGQLIGYTGATGRVTGAHLDYRIRDLSTGEYINPEEGITINVRQPEIIVTAQRMIREGEPQAQPTGMPASGTPDAIRNANSEAQNLRVTLDDILDVVNTGLARGMRQFTELSEAASERLGQDFGPQGKVLQALSQAMQTIPQKFQEVQTAINDIFSSSSSLVRDTTEQVQQATSSTAQTLQQGTEAVAAEQQKVKDGFTSMASSASAAFSAIASIIGAIGSILKASSDAKIAGIDKEIAAEQKRDGKSAESVAKLDALEKKKDSMARKSFNIQKKLMLAQAVMGTAAGITMALATLPPPFSYIMAGITGALGLAQVAIISGMQYESSYTPKSVSAPSAISVGKRSDTVDLAKGPNANAGGEAGFLRGTSGMGSNASNYRTVGSAYGGDLNRGYGNRGFVVGEKGPEVINPETPITVTPANEVQNSQPLNATFNIQALDASGVQDILVSQKGNIIKMLRDAANASGQRFMEDVNVNVYTRPNVGKL